MKEIEMYEVARRKMLKEKRDVFPLSVTLILGITQCTYLDSVYARNSTMQKIGSFVLQQARFVYSRSYAYRTVGGVPAYLRVHSYLGQRCNCILRNGCCDEIYNFALSSLRFSARIHNAISLDISVYRVRTSLDMTRDPWK